MHIFGAAGSHGACQFDIVGDYVESGTAGDLGDADNADIEWVLIAGYDCLEYTKTTADKKIGRWGRRELGNSLCGGR